MEVVAQSAEASAFKDEAWLKGWPLRPTTARYALPPPNVILQAGSALSLMVALAQTDLLAMLPRQWEDFPLTADALQIIPVEEVLPAPDVVLIRRPDLPLTPAGEHLVDLMLRFAPKA